MQNASSSLNPSWSLARGFSAVIGLLLAIEGCWGLASPVVFGLLTTNTLHASLHVMLGLVGLWAGFRSHARGFLCFLGSLLILVSVLWFAPPTQGLVAGLLNVNLSVAYVNLVLGALSLIVGITCTQRTSFDPFDGLTT